MYEWRQVELTLKVLVKEQRLKQKTCLSWVKRCEKKGQSCYQISCWVYCDVVIHYSGLYLKVHLIIWVMDHCTLLLILLACILLFDFKVYTVCSVYKMITWHASIKATCQCATKGKKHFNDSHCTPCLNCSGTKTILVFLTRFAIFYRSIVDMLSFGFKEQISIAPSSAARPPDFPYIWIREGIPCPGRGAGPWTTVRERKGTCQVHPKTSGVLNRCANHTIWRSVPADWSLRGKDLPWQQHGSRVMTDQETGGNLSARLDDIMKYN